MGTRSALSCPIASAVVASSLAGLASVSPAQGVQLHFDADKTEVFRGETVRWTVSASFTGYEDPSAYFGSFSGWFVASDSYLGTATNLEGLLSRDSGEARDYFGDVRDVAVSNLALLGTDDPSNPIEIFQFDVIAGELTEDAPLSYSANGSATVYPNNGLFTRADLYESVASTSDAVTVRGFDLDCAIVMNPDRTSAGFDESVVWTAAFEFFSDDPITLRKISGTLDASAGLLPPAGAVPLAGGNVQLEAIDIDTWSFEYTPDPLAIAGPGVIDLFSFEAQRRAPSSQQITGVFDAEVTYFGVEIPGPFRDLPISSSVIVESPDTPSVSLTLIPDETVIDRGATGIYRASATLSGGAGQSIEMRMLSGDLIRDSMVVQRTEVIPTAGEATSNGTSFRDLFGLQISMPKVPLPPDQPTDVFEILSETRDALGKYSYQENLWNATLFINGIEIDVPVTFTSADAIKVGHDFDFALRFVPRAPIVEQGREVRYDAVIELAPDAPRLRRLSLRGDTIGDYLATRRASESTLPSPEDGVFENIDPATGGPLRTDDTFLVGTEILVVHRVGDIRVGAVTSSTQMFAEYPIRLNAEVEFFGDPPIEISLANFPIESAPLTSIEHQATPFPIPGQGNDDAELLLLDEYTLLIGAAGNDTTPGRVHVYDITDPTSPVERASFASPVPEAGDGFGASMRHDGPLVLIQGGGASHLYDLGMPDDPRHLSTMPGEAGKIDDGLAVTSFFSEGTPRGIDVEVFDITDPSSPESVTSISLFSIYYNELETRWTYGEGLVVGISERITASPPFDQPGRREGDVVGSVYDARNGTMLSEFSSPAYSYYVYPNQRVTFQLNDSLIHNGAAYLSTQTEDGVSFDGNSRVHVVDLSDPSSPEVRDIIYQEFSDRPHPAQQESPFGAAIRADGDRLAIGTPYHFAKFSNAGISGGWVFLYDTNQQSNTRFRAALPGDPWLADTPDGIQLGTYSGFGEIFSLAGNTIALADLGTGLIAIERVSALGGCGDADVAHPLSVLDLRDIAAFVDAHVDGRTEADIVRDGVVDLADIEAFLDAFVTGCG